MCCHTVSLSQDGLTALSSPCQTTGKVLDNIGVITGKTAEKQDKPIIDTFSYWHYC